MGDNHYDNPEFFDKYSRMERSQKGLEGAGEWETLQKMLPGFAGKRVLDLGCGYGWHCLYALRQGAANVLGVDLSEKMLAVAREKSQGLPVRYERMAMEEADFAAGSFDIVLSSLSLHYIVDFSTLAQGIFRWLSPGGHFVFSAEHPVFTAHGSQDWSYDPSGAIAHFPVDRYFEEGVRKTRFLGEEVTKVHRTLTTYLQTLLGCRFRITGFAEPQPPGSMMDMPGMIDELRRPMMMIVSAQKD